MSTNSISTIHVNKQYFNNPCQQTVFQQSMSTNSISTIHVNKQYFNNPCQQTVFQQSMLTISISSISSLSKHLSQSVSKNSRQTMKDVKPSNLPASISTANKPSNLPASIPSKPRNQRSIKESAFHQRINIPSKNLITVPSKNHHSIKEPNHRSIKKPSFHQRT